MVFGGPLGNAGVRYPIPEDYWNPNAGGGPISRTPLNATRAYAGNTVYRSPLAIVPDRGPGGASDWRYLHDKMMLPDGRIVPRDSIPNKPFEPTPWSTPLDMSGALLPEGVSPWTVGMTAGLLLLAGIGVYGTVKG